MCSRLAAFVLLLVAVLPQSLTLAAPQRLPVPSRAPLLPKVTACDLSDAVIPFPANAAAAGLAVDAGLKPAFLALGRGVQNYTCVDGTYQTNMAAATLYDASCAFNTPFYTTLTPLALMTPFSAKVGSGSTLPAQIQSRIGSFKLGDHYFQKLSLNATSPNPVFDFRLNGRGDYVAVSKVAATPAPTNPTKNVAWLELQSIAGGLAKSVFRVETAGGQPPSSCSTAGEVITVNYAALYWFMK